MYSFPSSLYIRTQFREFLVRPTIRTRRELGYLKTRSRWPKTLRRFQLLITLLDAEDKETLRQFLENVSYGATEWEFVHPLTGRYHTVVLLDDEVELEYLKDGVHSVPLEAMETRPLPELPPDS